MLTRQRKTMAMVLCLLFPCNCCEYVVGERDFSCTVMTKELLVAEVERCISGSSGGESQLTATNLVDLCLDYDVDICFVIAQAHVESHFGTRGMAQKTHSVFNVGAGDGYQYDAIQKIYKYEHPDSSVAPYLDLLTASYLVEGRTEHDLMHDFTTPNGKRYATNPEYEKKLRYRYAQFKKDTRILELQSMMRCDTCGN